MLFAHFMRGGYEKKGKKKKRKEKKKKKKLNKNSSERFTRGNKRRKKGKINFLCVLALSPTY